VEWICGNQAGTSKHLNSKFLENPDCLKFRITKLSKALKTGHQVPNPDLSQRIREIGVKVAVQSNRWLPDFGIRTEHSEYFSVSWYELTGQGHGFDAGMVKPRGSTGQRELK